MSNEPTNADRAQWAKDALAVFTAATFSGGHPDTMNRDDLECAIGDLICDLMHYARQKGFDTGSIMQQACGHFGFELLEEELRPMKLKIIAIAHHRNGIAGAPFDIVLFRDAGPESSRKVAILFDEQAHCAVLDVVKLAAGDIAFRSNSWRGDVYEPELRDAITQLNRTKE